MCCFQLLQKQVEKSQLDLTTVTSELNELTNLKLAKFAYLAEHSQDKKVFNMIFHFHINNDINDQMVFKSIRVKSYNSMRIAKCWFLAVLQVYFIR